MTSFLSVQPHFRDGRYSKLWLNMRDILSKALGNSVQFNSL